MKHPPAILAIGGLDPTGQAGLAADLRAGALVGALVAPIAAALTVQGREGVRQVQPVAADFLQAQIRAALASLPVSAIKLGLLPSAAQVRALAEVLEEVPGIPVVLDPVLGATLGGSLVQPDYIPALRSALLTRVNLFTPNFPEAEALLGRSIGKSRGDLEAAARDLLGLGCEAVLLKGGHLDGAQSPDLLAEHGSLSWLEGPRVDTANTRGTGCTLATLIAVHLGMGVEVREACVIAKKLLTQMLNEAREVRWPQGAGPVGLG